MMRFKIDENLPAEFVEMLRLAQHDATSVLDEGLGGAADDRVAQACRTEGRAIVTANVVDFLELAHEAVASNAEHAGIVLVPSSFRGDEFQAIADGIFEALKPYDGGLRGLVVYIRRI